MANYLFLLDALNKTNTEYSDHLKRYTNLDENVFFYVTIAVVMIEMVSLYHSFFWIYLYFPFNFSHF